MTENERGTSQQVHENMTYLSSGATHQIDLRYCMQRRIVVPHQIALAILRQGEQHDALLKQVIKGLMNHPSVTDAEEKWRKHLDDQDWEFKRRLFEHDIEREQHANLRETRQDDEGIHG